MSADQESLTSVSPAPELAAIPECVLIVQRPNNDLWITPTGVSSGRLSGDWRRALLAALDAIGIGHNARRARVMIYPHGNGAVRLATTTGRTLTLLAADDAGPLRRAVADGVAQREVHVPT